MSIREKFGIGWLNQTGNPSAEAAQAAAVAAEDNSAAEAEVQMALATVGARVLYHLRDQPGRMAGISEVISQTGSNLGQLLPVVQRLAALELVRLQDGDKLSLTEKGLNSL